MKRRALVAIGAGVLMIGLLAPVASAGGTKDPLTQAARYLKAHGYVPLHPAAYARAKAAAAAATPPRSALAEAVTGPLAPVPGPSWNGLFQSNLTPPDPTGAVGPTRYLELVNLKVGIYDRTGAVLRTARLSALTGHPQGCLSDPQVMWDPGTQRFYYAVLDFCTNTIAWGFSKTDSPTGVSGNFCRFTADFGYGSNLPDYPKLGETADFLLIGVNVFTAGAVYTGSDVDWIAKPSGAGPIATCPAQGSFAIGKQSSLKNADGTLTSTPVPAVQTDPSATGWVVGDADVSTVPSANFLSVFKVTKNAITGGADIQGTGTTVTVSPYSMPPPAPQMGSVATLDTLDGRLERAVSGSDPARLGSPTAVWTAHAVFGGAGSEERWYEIDPVAHTLIQSGAATSASLFVWNGAISPDRAVSPSGSAFGADMVMGFNTSSPTTFPAIQMVSKIGAGPQSAFVLVKQSPGVNEDFSCGPTCRWGDYSGASPDPGASLAGASGLVWLSGEWNVASTGPIGTDWRTWNWAATP